MVRGGPSRVRRTSGRRGAVSKVDPVTDDALGVAAVLPVPPVLLFARR